LSAARPDSLARAGRIPGVTAAAIALLLIYLKKRGALANDVDENSDSQRKLA
jgi:tRNA uridine 5-carboxymethylaminomethyl modification enzyme